MMRTSSWFQRATTSAWKGSRALISATATGGDVWMDIRMMSLGAESGGCSLGSGGNGMQFV